MQIRPRVGMRVVACGDLPFKWCGQKGTVRSKCLGEYHFWWVDFDNTISGRTDWKLKPSQMKPVFDSLRHKVEYCLLNNISLEFSDEV